MQLRRVAGRRGGHRRRQTALGQKVQQLQGTRLQRYSLCEQVFTVFGIQPVALGEWKIRAEMLLQHLIAFPAGYADQRMTETVAHHEPDRGHGPLQRKVIDPLGVVQGPIHIQDHGFDRVRQCHAGSIGPATSQVHTGALNTGALMVTICYSSCAPIAKPSPKMAAMFTSYRTDVLWH